MQKQKERIPTANFVDQHTQKSEPPRKSTHTRRVRIVSVEPFPPQQSHARLLSFRNLQLHQTQTMASENPRFRSPRRENLRSDDPRLTESSDTTAYCPECKCEHDYSLYLCRGCFDYSDPISGRLPRFPDSPKFTAFSKRGKTAPSHYCIPPVSVVRFGKTVVSREYRAALLSHNPLLETEEIVGSALGGSHFSSFKEWTERSAEEEDEEEDDSVFRFSFDRFRWAHDVDAAQKASEDMARSRARAAEAWEELLDGLASDLARFCSEAAREKGDARSAVGGEKMLRAFLQARKTLVHELLSERKMARAACYKAADFGGLIVDVCYARDGLFGRLAPALLARGLRRGKVGDIDHMRGLGREVAQHAQKPDCVCFAGDEGGEGSVIMYVTFSAA